jgi:hypothetical protein
VKICKDSGLTINQSKHVAGESYIVVNYRANSQVTSIWVLWNARDEFFSARRSNTNARSLSRTVAAQSIEVSSPRAFVAMRDQPPDRVNSSSVKRCRALHAQTEWLGPPSDSRAARRPPDRYRSRGSKDR